MPTTRKRLLLLLAAAVCGRWRKQDLHANSPRNICSRPVVGSMAPEPEDLRSNNGVLEVDLTRQNES
jgi:hypothetical protein